MEPAVTATSVISTVKGEHTAEGLVITTVGVGLIVIVADLPVNSTFRTQPFASVHPPPPPVVVFVTGVTDALKAVPLTTLFTVRSAVPSL